MSRKNYCEICFDIKAQACTPMLPTATVRYPFITTCPYPPSDKMFHLENYATLYR